MKVTADEIRAIVHGVESSADVVQLDENMNFSDAGIDSLEIFSILLGVEEKFSVTIPEDISEKLNSISEILKYLETAVADE